MAWELLLSRPCFLERAMLGGCRLSLDGLGPQGAEASAPPSPLASVLEASAVTSLVPSCRTENQVPGVAGTTGTAVRCGRVLERPLSQTCMHPNQCGAPHSGFPFVCGWAHSSTV